MSNYIEYNDRIAFHPGYYIKEIINESGLTQEDFAKRLGTTPKNLSVLLHGKQDLSIDMAAKLSRMLDTTVGYWLNLQQMYDELEAEVLSAQELTEERKVFEYLDYKYFRENFGLPDLPKKIDKQIACLRSFLSLHSLTALKSRDLAVNFRSESSDMNEANIVRANAMVQIAINCSLGKETPKFNKELFDQAVEFALTQTENHENFLSAITSAFAAAGVDLIVLPSLTGSKVNGATKKIDGKIMLMMNDRRHFADTFWFTLFHEIGHIMNGDYGVTFEDNKLEDEADLYAQRKLIPQDEYEKFVEENIIYTEKNIREFAKKINRDPGIVFGRLQNDRRIPFSEKNLSNKLRHKYKVISM